MTQLPQEILENACQEFWQYLNNQGISISREGARCVLHDSRTIEEPLNVLAGLAPPSSWWRRLFDPNRLARREIIPRMTDLMRRAGLSQQTIEAIIDFAIHLPPKKW